MKRAALVLLALAGAACHPARSDAPRRTDEILFSHDFHTKMEFDCETCHKGVAQATDLSRSYLPKEATCLECHAEKKAENDCGFCHKDPKRPETYALRDIASRMPHARHQPPVAECKRCHTQLSEPGQPVFTPAGHDTCMSCHAHEEYYAQGKCDTCHDDLSRFATAPVASFSHQGDFLHTHGKQASTSAQTCARCHDQTSCSDCHAKTVATRAEVKFPENVAANFVHRGDFVTRHALEASATGGETCAKCHGTSFCESCHTLNKLTTNVVDPRNPHPAGWSFPGARDFHGDAARRDIASCASCHDQGAASVCVTCHRVGGVGGNPHPASWLDRHETSEIAKNGMCLACH